jgi:hypothetical protein
MGQLTLARFRGDTTWGLVIRILGTLGGGIVGTIMWYAYLCLVLLPHVQNIQVHLLWFRTWQCDWLGRHMWFLFPLLFLWAVVLAGTTNDKHHFLCHCNPGSSLISSGHRAVPGINEYNRLWGTHTKMRISRYLDLREMA